MKPASLLEKKGKPQKLSQKENTKVYLFEIIKKTTAQDISYSLQLSLRTYSDNIQKGRNIL